MVLTRRICENRAMGRAGLRRAASSRSGLVPIPGDLRQRRSGYLAIIVLVGLLGGLALGSIAAACRTASSFSVFWASTNPSSLVGATGVLNPTIGLDTGYNATLVKAIRHLHYVTQVESQSGIDFLPLQPNGLPLNDPNFYTPAAGNGYGSVDGLYFDQDKVTVIKGRMASENRPDELMLSPSGAAGLGLHVGSVLPVGIYTNKQTEMPGFGTAAIKPIRIIDEHVVGIALWNGSIIEDDVDQSGEPNNLFTPALTDQLLRCCVNYTETGIRVAGGARNIAAVQAELTPLLPKGFPAFDDAQSGVIDKAQRAIKPEALALGVFGAIVALAALLITGQVTSRQLRLGAEEREVLRAVGAGPTMTSTDGLIGIGAAIVVGSLLAAVVAVALSPLAPLGPVRPIYPDGGISFDWTVLGLGVVLLIVLLGATAALVSYRQAPHRLARRSRSRLQKPSSVVGAAEAAGLSAPAVAGARLASRREAVAARYRFAPRFWERPWLFWCSSQPSHSVQVSTRWSPTPPFMDGTGTTYSLRAATFQRARSRDSWTTTGTYPSGRAHTPGSSRSMAVTSPCSGRARARQSPHR